MVILVGTIVIPIMLTAGISQFVASIVVISAVGVGALFNVSNWAVYVDVLGLSVQTIADYTLVAALPLILVSLAMIIFYIRRDGKGRKAWAMPTASGGEGKKCLPLPSLARLCRSFSSLRSSSTSCRRWSSARWLRYC